MPRTSSHSARHDAVPADRVIAAARRWTEHLCRNHPEVVRVGYFGSYARGDYVPGSDFDVLLEVGALPALPGHAADTPLVIRRADYALHYRPDSFPVGLEIFVYTSDELTSLRETGSAFIRTIDREVRWLSGSQ